jgi:hypothetical protein
LVEWGGGAVAFDDGVERGFVWGVLVGHGKWSSPDEFRR